MGHLLLSLLHVTRSTVSRLQEYLPDLCACLQAPIVRRADRVVLGIHSIQTVVLWIVRRNGIRDNGVAARSDELGVVELGDETHKPINVLLTLSLLLLGRQQRHGDRLELWHVLGAHVQVEVLKSKQESGQTVD